MSCYKFTMRNPVTSNSTKQLSRTLREESDKIGRYISVILLNSKSKTQRYVTTTLDIDQTLFVGHYSPLSLCIPIICNPLPNPRQLKGDGYKPVNYFLHHKNAKGTDP